MFCDVLAFGLPPNLLDMTAVWFSSFIGVQHMSISGKLIDSWYTYGYRAFGSPRELEKVKEFTIDAGEAIMLPSDWSKVSGWCWTLRSRWNNRSTISKKNVTCNSAQKYADI